MQDKKLSENWKAIGVCLILGLLSAVVFQGGIILTRSAKKEITPKMHAYRNDKELSEKLGSAAYTLKGIETRLKDLPESNYITEARTKLETLKAETDKRISDSGNEARPTKSTTVKQALGMVIGVLGGMAAIVTLGCAGVIFIFQIINYSRLFFTWAYTKWKRKNLSNKLSNHLGVGQD